MPSQLASQYLDQEPCSLPWLGSFPTHWKLAPGFAVLRERQVKNVGMAGKTVLSLSYGRVIVKPEEKLRGLVPESFETYQIVEPGNIIIRPTDLQNDQVSLRVGQVKDRGIITSAYLCLETYSDLSADYGHLLLLAYDLKKVFYGLGSGLRQNLSWNDFRRLPIPLPSPLEQEQIVRFVRQLDSRVNRLIKAKRRLIELLNEQKQTIIHQAVTRGLDPTVRLKPSGIDWLGDIPAHWDVRRVKSLSPVKRGASPRPIADPKYFSDEGDFAWVRIADVSASNRFLEATTERLSDLGASLSVKMMPGSLFLSIAGSVGKPIISKIKCCIHDGFVYFPRLAENVEYMYYLFSTGRMYDGLGKLGTQLNLNTETVGSITIPLPPRVEQQEIATWLDHELSQFDIVLGRVNAEIDLIREYRTRLVADVVTGQLDVRQHPWANTEIEEPTEAITDDAELEDDLEETDDVLEEAGV